MFGDHPLVNMHQINGFSHVTVLPTALYGERTLLMGGKVCVPKDTDLSVVDWLDEVGLAPDEIIRIPDSCMFAGLKRQPELMDKLAELFAQGFRPMFFHTTELEAEFVERMGLAWNQTASCDPMIADLFGHKDFVRRTADALGCPKAFPPHIIVHPPWDTDTITEAVHEVRRMARDLGMRHVMVKRTDLVSGEGMLRTTSPQFRPFLSQNRRHPLIVEVEIDPHVPISNQWFVQDGKAVYVGASRQIQDGYVHKGNIMASFDRVLPEDVLLNLHRLTKTLVGHAVSMGYNGVLGFDAVWNQERGLLYLTEANARVTASTYPLKVAHRLGFTTWSIANQVIVPAPWFETFNSVRGALGPMLYNPRRQKGVIPYMLGALKLTDMRRMGLMAIADIPRHAELALDEAIRRLTQLRD